MATKLCSVKRESNEGGLIPRAFSARAFENELEYHYLYVRINSSDDQAASGINQRSSKNIYVCQVAARLCFAITC